MSLAKGLVAVGLRRGSTVLAFGVEGVEGLLMFIACSSIGVKFAVSEQSSDTVTLSNLVTL